MSLTSTLVLIYFAMFWQLKVYCKGVMLTHSQAVADARTWRHWDHSNYFTQAVQNPCPQDNNHILLEDTHKKNIHFCNMNTGFTEVANVCKWDN